MADVAQLHELEALVENAPPDEALAAARQLVEIRAGRGGPAA